MKALSHHNGDYTTAKTAKTWRLEASGTPRHATPATPATPHHQSGILEQFRKSKMDLPQQQPFANSTCTIPVANERTVGRSEQSKNSTFIRVARLTLIDINYPKSPKPWRSSLPLMIFLRDITYFRACGSCWPSHVEINAMPRATRRVDVIFLLRKQT